MLAVVLLARRLMPLPTTMRLAGLLMLVPVRLLVLLSAVAQLTRRPAPLQVRLLVLHAAMMLLVRRLTPAASVLRTRVSWLQPMPRLMRQQAAWSVVPPVRPPVLPSIPWAALLPVLLSMLHSAVVLLARRLLLLPMIVQPTGLLMLMPVQLLVLLSAMALLTRRPALLQVRLLVLHPAMAQLMRQLTQLWAMGRAGHVCARPRLRRPQSRRAGGAGGGARDGACHCHGTLAPDGHAPAQTRVSGGRHRRWRCR